MKKQADKLFLPATWKKWVAENVLLGNDPAGLVKILVQNGFSQDLSQLEVDAAAAHPYVEAARSLARQMKKRDWVFDTIRLLQNSDPRWVVERREAVSADVFLRDYYFANRPVILCDVIKHWPGITKWNADYLKERCGDQIVKIQSGRNSNANYEIENKRHESTARFAEFVDRVFHEGSTNDYYMTANNSDANANILEELRDDFELPQQYLDPTQSAGRVFFWFGPAGTVTPVHHDLTNNFMAQVVGRKQIKLISPIHQPLLYNHLHCYSRVDLENIDLEKYPQFRHVRIHEIVLHPGDLFFLPVGWWHHVRGLDPSITITCTNFRARNDFASFYRTYAQI